MDSGTTKYLMDTNAIRVIDVTTFDEKKNNNRIIATIDEVKYELPESSKHKIDHIIVEQLRSESYKKMAEILNKHKTVRSVLDYYENKGTADVPLLAHALMTNEGMLYTDKITIVTDDVGLQIACKTLTIAWISSSDFKKI